MQGGAAQVVAEGGGHGTPGRLGGGLVGSGGPGACERGVLSTARIPSRQVQGQSEGLGLAAVAHLPGQMPPPAAHIILLPSLPIFPCMMPAVLQTAAHALSIPKCAGPLIMLLEL